MKVILFLLLMLPIVGHCQRRPLPTTTVKLARDESIGEQLLPKIECAITLLEEIYNSDDFVRLMIDERFTFHNHGMSSNDILSAIRYGRDNYRNMPNDSTVTLNLILFGRRTRWQRVHYTNKYSRVTRIHRCAVENSEIGCLVALLAFEHMRQIGFLSKRKNLFGTSANSVPAKVSEITRDVLRRKCGDEYGFSCFSARGSCYIYPDGY